jgi:hypothetical protein
MLHRVGEAFICHESSGNFIVASCSFGASTPASQGSSQNEVTMTCRGHTALTLEQRLAQRPGPKIWGRWRRLSRPRIVSFHFQPWRIPLGLE